MKKIVVSLLAGLSLLACQKQASNGFILEGNIEGLSNGQVYLLRVQDHRYVTADSAIITKGAFSFKGEVEFPEMFQVQLGKKRPIPVFLENEKISLQGHVDSLFHIKVAGSKSHEEMLQISDSLSLFLQKRRPLYSEYRKANKLLREAEEKKDMATIAKAKSQMKDVEVRFDALQKEGDDFLKNYIIKHPFSVAASYQVLMRAYNASVEDLKAWIDLFDPSIAKSPYMAEMVKRYIKLSKTAVGQIAPDFTLNDPDGNPISLSSFRGKVLLVDFWASWCGSCRIENPEVVKLYKEYHDKGFDILSVSLDSRKEEWVKAIEEDGLVWNNCSDLKKFRSEVAELYRVNSIPYTVLIDKEGKIIARSLRGDELKEKVKELLN